MNLKSLFISLWLRFKNYLWPKKGDLKAVDVKKLTENDLNELGRAVHSCKVENAKIKTFNSSILMVRNKKNEVLFAFSGTLDQVKSKFGDNYEIVESAIKEKTDTIINLDSMDSKERNNK